MEVDHSVCGRWGNISERVIVMRNEIMIRKKRMWAFVFAIALSCMIVSPFMVYAENYSNVKTDPASVGDGQILMPGDTIAITDETRANCSFTYYDWDDSDGSSIDTAITVPGESHTVAAYKGKMEAKNFGGWKVKSIVDSGNYIVAVTFSAVKKSSITYVLNGGTHTEKNPSSYIEGEGTELSSAFRSGYTFDGWYSDADFNTPVTAISDTQTGDITLYAKFTLNENAVVESKTVHLNAGTEYELGDGRWKVAGDNTVYSGGITFYVPNDADYTFTKQ